MLRPRLSPFDPRTDTGLFSALETQLGRIAQAKGNLEEALRYFDQAAAILFVIVLAISGILIQSRLLQRPMAAV